MAKMRRSVWKGKVQHSNALGERWWDRPSPNPLDLKVLAREVGLKEVLLPVDDLPHSDLYKVTTIVREPMARAGERRRSILATNVHPPYRKKGCVCVWCA